MDNCEWYACKIKRGKASFKQLGESRQVNLAASISNLFSGDQDPETNVALPETIAHLDLYLDDADVNCHDLEILKNFNKIESLRLVIQVNEKEGATKPFEIRKYACLNSGLLNGLYSLSRLYVADVSAVYLSEGFFRDTPNLQVLEASTNEIRVLSPRVFSALNRLRELDLSFNKIEHLDAKAFSFANELSFLNLRGNAIRELESGVFFRLSRLRRLNLEDNEIEQVQIGTFEGLQELQQLTLARNRIERFDARVLNPLVAIRVVSLEGNCIVKFSREKRKEHLNCGPQLKIVNLSRNKLTALLDSEFCFGDCSQLVSLDLSGAAIQSLEEGWAPKLSRLKRLNLAGNGLRYLPLAVFDSLARLQSLDLSRNAIRQIDAGTFLGLFALKKLDLSHNRISNLSPGTFSHAIFLDSLNISHNQTVTLASHYVSDCYNLTFLDFSANRIECVESNCFENTCRLSTLILSGNRLDVFACEKRRLPELRTLSLRRNRLKRIDESVFRHLERLECLDVRENDIVRVNVPLLGESSVRLLRYDENKVPRRDAEDISRIALAKLRQSLIGRRQVDAPQNGLLL